CHRLVLMAASPFFETMFRSELKESKQGEIDFDFLNAEIAGKVVDYFYSGEIDINSVNVSDLLEASEYLCLDDLKRHLCDFMATKVDSTNCIELYRVSHKYGLDKLEPICFAYIVSAFHDVFSSPVSFEGLSEEEVVKVVSDDRLTAQNEDVVFHFVVRWVNADLDKRKDIFPKVASFVRFPYCSQECLHQMTREPLMINSTCMDFLHEGLSLDVGSKRIELHSKQNARSVPRLGYDATVPHLMQISVDIHSIRGQICIDESSHTWEWKHCFRAGNPSRQGELEVFFSPKAIHWREVNSCQSRNKSGQKSLSCWSMDTQQITKLPWVEPQIPDSTLMFVHEKIFSFGGTKNGQTCEMVESFDPTRRRWNAEPPMIHAVSKPIGVHFDARVYILGGTDADGPTIFTQEFDPVLSTWRLRSSMPAVCQFGAAVSLNDKVFVVGGEERACFCYKPAMDTW
ncbi:hypothetical protein CAPTEDRAFT_63102, partial [Capitella teleta]